MAHGLQTFNSAGQILLDTSTFTGKFLGQISVMSNTGIPAAATDVTVSVTKDPLEKIWATMFNTDPLIGANYMEIASINNTTSNFVYRYYNLHHTPAREQAVVFYGVY
jgi:hypothetical protein